MSEGQMMTIPQWAAPALVALVLGLGGGYVGGTTATNAEPAVLAEGVARLRDDLGGMRGEVRDLTAEVRTLSVSTFPRSEHDAWIRSTYRPELTAITVQLERQRTDLEALRLELRTRQETPWTP